MDSYIENDSDNDTFEASEDEDVIFLERKKPQLAAKRTPQCRDDSNVGDQQVPQSRPKQ